MNDDSSNLSIMNENYYSNDRNEIGLLNQQKGRRNKPHPKYFTS